MLHRCGYCGGDFPSQRARRAHPCDERDIAYRARALRWPTEPVIDYLVERYGTFESANPEGYCGSMVERLTGVLRSTWQEACREGGLRDETADRIASALGARHEQFWPGWHAALDVTDADRDWLDRWSKGA